MVTTAVDTNVISALWGPEDSLNARAQQALDASFNRGPLVISAPVFAELMAAPGRTVGFLDRFLANTGIAVDWDLNESVWRAAGEAYQTYAERRRRHPEPGPRRILADFVIGAHAVRYGCHLLTLDTRIYRIAFPQLTLISV